MRLSQKQNFVIDLALMFPFAYFFISELMQDSSCKPDFVTNSGTAISVFCFGKPDIFKHSLFYDLFFLRGGVDYFGSHWFSQLLLPVLFFVLMFAAKNIRFAFFISIFYLFYHELVWNIFEIALNNQPFDIFWIAFLFISMIIAVVAYPKIFRTWIFAFMTEIYILFCFQWWIQDRLHTTIAASGLGKTPWYSQALTNEFEVGSWFVAFISMLICALVFLYNNKQSRINRDDSVCQVNL